MERAPRIYFAHLPRRCAGQRPGLTGICLACGARPGELCQARPADRYKPAEAQA